jgi:hypothetical protein
MNDYEIRENLCDYFHNHFGKIRIFDELTIGNSRADIVTVTDCLTGYEIKSDRDSYVRLAEQVKSYDRYFERNYIVIGKRHLNSVKGKVPTHWGVICVNEQNGSVAVEQIRQAELSLTFDIENQLTLLWKSELSNILVNNKLPKYRQKSKYFIADVLIKRVPIKKLKADICAELFERDYSRFGSK